MVAIPVVILCVVVLFTSGTNAGYATHETNENSKALFNAYTSIVGVNENNRQERTEVYDDAAADNKHIGGQFGGTEATSNTHGYGAGAPQGGCVGAVCSLPTRQLPTQLNTNDIDEPNTHIGGLDSSAATNGAGKLDIRTSGYGGAASSSNANGNTHSGFGFVRNDHSDPALTNPYDSAAPLPLDGNAYGSQPISPGHNPTPSLYPANPAPYFPGVPPTSGVAGGFVSPSASPQHSTGRGYGSGAPVPSIYPHLQPEPRSSPAPGYPTAPYPVQPPTGYPGTPQVVFPGYPANPQQPYGPYNPTPYQQGGPYNPTSYQQGGPFNPTPHQHGGHDFGPHHHHPHDHSQHGYGYHDGGSRPHHHVDHSLHLNSEYKEDGHHVGPLQHNNGYGFGSGYGGGYNGAYNRPGY